MHWLYIWPANPLGVLLTLRLVVYVGETNNLGRRTAQHLKGAWWRWLTWGVPLAVPLVSRRSALWWERRLVRLLRPAANREWNRGDGLRPGVVLARLVGGLSVVALVSWLTLAR